MIDETVTRHDAILATAQAHGIPGYAHAAQTGAEIGVGLRLRILKEAKERIRSAEMKALEGR